MALERAGVPGRALMIEVTETSLVHDLTTAAEHIAQLLALGVRTSVDDFGTGYTSVSHLRRLPISEVKIDRSFIQGMGADDRARVLVDLMARIGTMPELHVVAQVVETPEQLEAGRSIGCHYVQGFLPARPVTTTALEVGHGQVARRQDGKTKR